MLARQKVKLSLCGVCSNIAPITRRAPTTSYCVINGLQEYYIAIVQYLQRYIPIYIYIYIYIYNIYIGVGSQTSRISIAMRSQR